MCLKRGRLHYDSLNLTISEKELIKDFFLNTGYKNFQKNYSKYFLDLIGIDTCVYCNRNYTINLTKTHARAELDHWFPKTDFPLLALSFYNLIPSCATCNSIKSNANLNTVEHLHPYIDVNIASSYSFGYLPLSINKNQIIFRNNSLFNTKGIDTVKALNLELIYKGHSDKELQDLIDLRYK